MSILDDICKDLENASVLSGRF